MLECLQVYIIYLIYSYIYIYMFANWTCFFNVNAFGDLIGLSGSLKGADSPVDFP